ncbi:MAG: tRNA lysidine(34) synthetase TilS [Clostridia bacterium]|nr:tRNA lysidine(34) synthetase TilS [Clostridia bacterium]
MLEEKVLQTIVKNKLIQNGDKIVIGVSGGPDSIALLDVLIKLQNKIKFDITVAHINHMIRAEAIDDQKYVEQYCKNKKIKCFVKQAKVEEVAKNQKIGTEEAGRNLRYEFFNEILEKTNSNKIATAHSKNDNAETVLMNILRGSGTSGLKGIQAARDDKYIRPLIECERKEIEEYCNENNLEPRIDKTNMENIYTRNKVRNLLIPYIQREFNPNIIEALNRLSQIASMENEYFKLQTIKIYNEIKEEETKEQITLNLKKFNSQKLVIKNRIVLYTINRLFGSSSGIEKIHLQDIIKLCGNNIGNKFLVPNKKVKVLVKSGKIFFIVNK